MAPRTTHERLPPFPSDVPTAPLESISLCSLQSHNPSVHVEESAKLFEACKTLGFFYLDLLGSELGEEIVEQSEQLHELQQEFFALPHEDKDEYGRDKVDPFFSYRWTRCEDGVIDSWGRKGRREMYSMRADDFTQIRPQLPKHPLVTSSAPIFTSFARNCRNVVELLLSVLEGQLELAPGTLLDLHDKSKPSGDFISLQHRASEIYDDVMVRKGEHTDFGSITMLFNWLGGLQIRDQSQYVSTDPHQAQHSPDPDEASSRFTAGRWVYVKPIPGSAVINLADSLVRLTAGVLKSNIHRVAPAPGNQGGLPRYSLVYFAHPNDDVPLVPVKGGMVGEASVRGSNRTEGGIRKEGVEPRVDAPGRDIREIITAAEWTNRRSLGDLRGVYTYEGGVELRDNDDAVVVLLSNA